jgi:hypothetical protein
MVLYMNTTVILRKNKAMVAIILFLVLFFIVHTLKPSIIYTKEGGFRTFGIGYKHKTVVPIWIVSICLAILSYLAVSYYVMHA